MKIKSKKVYDAPRFKNIREVLENSVKLYPESTAFILKEKKENEVTYKNITFTQLQEEVNYLGTALISLGLKGKRIAIISPNRYEWCVSYLAILNGVGIAVPLDKSLPEEELIGSLERSKADAVIFDKKYEETMKKLQKENDKLKKQLQQKENIINKITNYCKFQIEKEKDKFPKPLESKEWLKGRISAFEEILDNKGE